MGDHKAFFYGTLMAPEVLHRVCHGTSTPAPWQKSLLTIRPAILHDYVRRKVKLADYPAIIPSRSSSIASHDHSTPTPSVRGTFVTGLTDGDLWRLDIFEGDEYVRESVKVYPLRTIGDDAGHGNVEEEEAVEVQTYVWVAGEDKLEGEEWDFSTFVREKMWRWAGSASEKEGEYDEVDRAAREMIEKGVDPTGGRGAYGAITNELKARGGEGDLKAAV